MLSIDWVAFLLKLVLFPTFIGLVSLAGRRWGSTVSGWLIGLPLSSGPIAFILTLEQGTVFAARASGGIILGIVSDYAFCLAYSWTAMRRGWVESILVAMIAFILGTITLNTVTLSLPLESAAAVLSLLIALCLMPRVGSDHQSPQQTRWEIPLRMASGTVLVFLITELAGLLGPQLTGLLTPFPIYVTTMGVFTHRSQGGEESVKLLRGTIIGTFTFIVFFLIVSLTIVAWGLAFSFLAAIGASFVVHLTSLQLLRFRNRIIRNRSGFVS